jgi:hypothetical protein
MMLREAKIATSPGLAAPWQGVDRLAEQRVRGNIAHRVSTTVRNLIAFFG